MKKTRSKKYPMFGRHPILIISEIYYRTSSYVRSMMEGFRNSACLLSFLVLACIALMSSCNLPAPKQLPGDPTPDLELINTKVAEYRATASATAFVPQEPTATEAPTATPKKVETLTICLGKEPNTLFFYDESSAAMWSVLESIYDGPFDKANGESIPVIFDEVTVETENVTVIRGDIIADINEEAVELKPGTVFLQAEPPENCSGSACMSTWYAVTESAEIPQTIITFHLKESLSWNDGTPLTAEDSVFSMNVNGMKGINASKRLYNMTDSYKALDEHTVEWRGLPGYTPDDPADVFWTPLPKHLMKGMDLETIRTSESINETPLGWGAWQITSWDKGNEIVAERNPYYFGEQPFFDRVVYKFFGRPGDNNIAALQSGTCDIIDPSVDLGFDLEPILEDVRDGKESIYIQPELTRQEMVFNLEHTDGRTAELFTSAELRTAVTRCIDRTALIRQVLYGQSEIPVDFYPAESTEHAAEAKAVPYEPEAAKKALENLGWTLPEDDPDGIRTATGVTGIPYGTKLSFNLVTSDSKAAIKAAEMIKSDLAQCGIEVQHDSLSLGGLYAQGPDGTIFGRKFDTAMFAWSASDDPCRIYMSRQIPSASNHWIGTNTGSYQNEIYDEACMLPALTEADARLIYAEELPAIPLYFNISIGLSANDICGISDRIGSRSILWNIESLSRAEDSCAVSQWNNIYR